MEHLEVYKQMSYGKDHSWILKEFASGARDYVTRYKWVQHNQQAAQNYHDSPAETNQRSTKQRARNVKRNSDCEVLICHREQNGI